MSRAEELDSLLPYNDGDPGAKSPPVVKIDIRKIGVIVLHMRNN